MRFPRTPSVSLLCCMAPLRRPPVVDFEAMRVLPHECTARRIAARSIDGTRRRHLHVAQRLPARLRPESCLFGVGPDFGETPVMDLSDVVHALILGCTIWHKRPEVVRAAKSTLLRIVRRINRDGRQKQIRVGTGGVGGRPKGQSGRLAEQAPTRSPWHLQRLELEGSWSDLRRVLRWSRIWPP